MTSSIKRLGLFAAFIALGTTSFALSSDQQIKISRALNSPTLAVKYSGAHAALVELRLNGESFGTRTMDDAPAAGETTFSLDLLALKDGDNDIEILLYDKDGHLLGTEKTSISTDQNSKGPIFLSTPPMGANVMGPVEITVGFGKDFKNSYVSFFVDNQFKSMMNFPPFTYNWDSTRESNGWHELEAWVVDDTSATYKTRKVRVFVNNPSGHTFRIAPAPSKPVAKPAARTFVPAVKHPPVVIKPAKNVAPLPEPSPINLTPSANQVASSISGISAPLKAIAQATSTLSVAKTTAIAPEVVGFVSQNSVTPHLEGRSAGIKPSLMPSSVAIGLRVMTPTGKRLVAQKVPVVPKAAATVLAAPQIPKVPVVAPAKPAAVIPSPITAIKTPVKISADPQAAPVAPAVIQAAKPVAAPVAPAVVQAAKTVAAPVAPVVIQAPAKAAKPAAAPVAPTILIPQKIESKPAAIPVATPQAATVAKPITNPVLVPAPQKPAPVAERPAALVDASTLLAVVPATSIETSAATFKPLGLDMTGEGMSARPASVPLQPSDPVVPAPATPITSASMTSLGSTDSVIKATPVAATKPMAIKASHHAKMLAVEYGTRFPAHATFSIIYAGTPLSFDVAPTVIQGVPMTPFRHLIEHAGGEVKWQPLDKEVEATTDGKTIWLKIGDKVAKIDATNIQLELAPLIKSGRTIVPLSFIKQALNVDIDYDKATGHVLITPKK